MGPRISPYNNKLLLLASLSCLVGRSYAWGSNCSYDVYGVERCDGLSYGARVGIAVAILALLVLLLGVLFARRRRLARQQQEALANGRPAPSQAYSQQQQGVPMYGYAPQQGYNNTGNYNNGGPQYYESPQAQTYNYGPSAETWQPPPPKYEPPPPDAQSSFKGPEGSSAGYNVNPPPASDGYAPPAGPPPNMSSTQPQQGNDNRV